MYGMGGPGGMYGMGGGPGGMVGGGPGGGWDPAMGPPPAEPPTAWQVGLSYVLLSDCVAGGFELCIIRVGQNRIYTPYMTVCMVIPLPRIPYIHPVYTYKCIVMANPSYVLLGLPRPIYIIYIYGVCAVFLAGKSPNIRSYTVYIYGSGQTYVLCCSILFCVWWRVW